MKNILKKQDILLITALLLISAALFLGNWLIRQKPSSTVKVIVDAAVVEELDLGKDAQLVINNARGGTNTLVIKDGNAFISDASCPDKICMHQGSISHTGEMIVCLPNLVIIRIDGEDRE